MNISNYMLRLAALTILVIATVSLSAQRDTLYYEVSMENPHQSRYQVKLNYKVEPGQNIDLSMPAWSPGHWQILDFGNTIDEWSVFDDNGKPLPFEKIGLNTWRISTGSSREIRITYEAKSGYNFVTTGYLFRDYGYIKPAAVFMYPAEDTAHPVSLIINPYPGWKDIVTGLESSQNNPYSFKIENIDVLYENPILIGNVDKYPSFKVRNTEFNFKGIDLGIHDDFEIMKDLKKVVEEVDKIFGEIPFERYDFIGTGRGRGSTDHLNSSVVSFDQYIVSGWGKPRVMSYLTHNYFHAFNGKRIRPADLIKFDYSKPDRTNLLWMTEGWTAYYEKVLINRAGILSGNELLEVFSNTIYYLQGNKGRLNQTLDEASANTWEDMLVMTGNKNVSYYEKGPLVALLLDIAIRNETQNNKSLDDVMSMLYNKFYKEGDGGYTKEDLVNVCEEIAGVDLSDIFQYTSTTVEMDYKKYFDRAGLDMDDKYVLRPKIKLTKLQQSIFNDLFVGYN